MKNSILSKLRRLMALTLALLLIVSLTGCFKKDDPDTPDSTEDQSQTDPTQDTPTDAPTDPPTDPPTTPPVDTVMGTVSANNLYVRTKPSATSSTVIGMLPVNLRVELLEQTTETNAKGDVIHWGRIGEMTLPSGTKINGGWINLTYVKIDGETTDEPSTPSTGNNNTTVSGTGKKGTITATKLNIRKNASTNSDSVGTYIKGDTVEILEQKTVDGTVWGRTNTGWISMKYVKLEGSTGTTATDDKDDDDSTGTEIVSNGKTTALGYGVVDLGALNVRSGPGTKYDKVGTVSQGERYAYYQKSGNWVRIKTGWVSTSYLYIEGTSASDGGTGTVTATELNLRSGPDTSYKSKGVLKQGDTVKILGQANGWGYTSNGWVSMKYVTLTSTGVTYTTGTGTVTTDLNIRKEANSESDRVGGYKTGDVVTITEVSNEWGKTDKGWINLKYVSMSTAADTTGTNTTFKTGTATVKVNSSLTIREGANTDAKKVGSYKNGDKVTIVEQNGEWGKTDKGWINLRYVIFD